MCQLCEGNGSERSESITYLEHVHGERLGIKLVHLPLLRPHNLYCNASHAELLAVPNITNILI